MKIKLFVRILPQRFKKVIYLETKKFENHFYCLIIRDKLCSCKLNSINRISSLQQLKPIEQTVTINRTVLNIFNILYRT